MNSTYAAAKQATVSTTSATICGHTSNKLWSSEKQPRDPLLRLRVSARAWPGSRRSSTCGSQQRERDLAVELSGSSRAESRWTPTLRDLVVRRSAPIGAMNPADQRHDQAAEDRQQQPDAEADERRRRGAADATDSSSPNASHSRRTANVTSTHSDERG